MSALVVIHPGQAAGYGAEELKSAAHRFGFLGLSISILIHFTVIASYYFTGGNDRTIPVDGLRKPHVINVDFPPFIPGVYELPPIAHPRLADPHVEKGTPVPVVDDPVSVNQTIATQRELGGGVDPHGTEVSGGRPVAIPENLPDDNVPPDSFVEVEKYPQIVKAVKPAYPPLAIRAGLEGKVIVKIWVDRLGKTRQVEIVRSDHEIFNEAALDAARQYVFTPAYMNNGPVSVWVAVPFTFQLSAAK